MILQAGHDKFQVKSVDEAHKIIALIRHDYDEFGKVEFRLDGALLFQTKASVNRPQKQKLTGLVFEKITI